MVDNIIETFDISKIYKLKGQNKEIHALNNINFSVKKGEIFGFLGPNGAGKTTLIQILTTLKQPTSGYANIYGYNILKHPKKAKSNIALMLDNKMLYFRITGYDNLKFFCKIYKVPNYQEKIKNITKEFGLEKWIGQLVEHYSSGMKMKLALCRTLLLNREILFLDEPTLGLDVKSVAFIVEKLRNIEKTIFLTSHDMRIVEKLCDRIAFISKGNIIKIGTKKDIQELYQSEIKIKVTIQNDTNKLIDELNSRNDIQEIIKVKDGIEVILENRHNLNKLLSILGNYNVLKIMEDELSVEDIFLKIT